MTAVEPPPPAKVALPRLFDLMERLPKLTIGELTIYRKDRFGLCWIRHTACPAAIGKIDGGRLDLFDFRLQHVGLREAPMVEALLAVEADPDAAAALHGKAGGRRLRVPS